MMTEHIDLETEPNFLSDGANKAIPRLLALLRIEPSTNPSAMAVGCNPHFEELLLLRTLEGPNTQNVLTKTRSLIRALCGLQGARSDHSQSVLNEINHSDDVTDKTDTSPCSEQCSIYSRYCLARNHLEQAPGKKVQPADNSGFHRS